MNSIKFKNIKLLFIFYALLLLLSCDKGIEEENTPAADIGHIKLKFTHLVDGKPLQIDTMMYFNAAGNPYEINEVMYFISDVTLHQSYESNRIKNLIDDWKDIHYVDIDYPSTLTWEVYDDLPVGKYDSITFVFGITEEKNESFMFVDNPEAQMMWPDVLGGGYHYLMINGKWLDTNNEGHLYNFHLGIGQLYKGDVINYDSIYAFVQNYFTVKLPGSSFTLEKNETKEIEVIMQIDSWFTTPHNFDFNYWGGAIMEVQPAMQMAKENGFDVFTTGTIQ